MKFKNGFYVILLTGLSLLIFSLTACDNNAPIEPETTDQEAAESVNVEDSDFSVYEFEDEMAAINDASADTEMSLSQESPRNHNQLMHNRGSNRFRHYGRHNGMHLGYALFQLALTDTQKVQVREFMHEYRDCITTPIMEFREAAKPIMEQARAEWKALRDSIRADSLSHQEARAQFQALNQEKREAIKNLAVDLGLLEAMCACKQTLFDNIASILDANQLPTFEEWLAQRSGPCFPDAGDSGDTGDTGETGDTGDNSGN